MTERPTGCPVRHSDWDPREPETFDSPHVVYEQLRRTCPVPWSDAFGGFWAATTYKDVELVSRDRRFITSVQNVVPHVPRKQRRPPLHLDPPEHSKYREPINRVLARTKVRRLSAAFGEAARQQLRPLVEAGGGDFSGDFALPYAVHCFAIFLGVPVELATEIRQVGVEYSFAIQDMDDARIKTYSDALYEIAGRLIADRRAGDYDPETDLVASLLAALDDPANGLDPDLTLGTVRQTIVAGIGAPHAALGSAIVHLARDTELQARLRAEPTLLPRANEELLRLYAPYRVFARTATVDVQVGDRTIAQGEPITMIFPSANRDETVFERPHELDLERWPNKHISFGRGAHRCPGAPMARYEMREALSALLQMTSRFELAGEVEMFNWLEFGPKVTPLRVEAAQE